MTEGEFRRAAAAKGYQPPNGKTWEAGRFNDWHTHPFDLYVHILEGEMTLQVEAGDGSVAVTTIGAGEQIEVPAEARHTERIGAAAAYFLSAPRPVS